VAQQMMENGVLDDVKQTSGDVEYVD